MLNLDMLVAYGLYGLDVFVGHVLYFLHAVFHRLSAVLLCSV